MKHRSWSTVKILIFAAGASVLLITLGFRQAAVGAIRSIVFPVVGSTRYSDDYLSPRSDGPHHATDIFANKMQRIISPVDGVITYVGYPQPSWGYMISIRDDDDYTYNFIHINNDTPGTDDGKGGPMHAYAADMKRGNRVAKGQHIAYVGDSGNAENTAPHLHFEIIKPNGDPENPYPSLQRAVRLSKQQEYPQLDGELLPFGNAFKGGVSATVGNFIPGGQEEYVVAAGKDGSPKVKLYNANNTYANVTFDAYSPSFKGGVDIASGDLDGDGIDEIVTGAGPGGGPTVKVFKADGTPVRAFFAYSSSFKGGVKVAVGDVDGDGVNEIVTGAGPGGGPTVKVFKANSTPVQAFFAYSSGFRGGIDVAAGDVAGGASDEIITSVGSNGPPKVTVFDGVGSTHKVFLPYTEKINKGVRVSVGEVVRNNQKREILTVPAYGGPHLRALTAEGITLSRIEFMEEWWQGYHDVAGGNEYSKATTGINRRASVRDGGF